MEHSPHVLLIGDGATAFCREAGLAFADRDYFFTETRWRALTATLEDERAGQVDADESRRHGTVGAVARDRAGNLAAATSTGGMTGKLPGRVGDSPIVGAGTFADNATCAVSATGHGELFIRYAAAHEIAARIAHRRQSLAVAAQVVVAELGAVGGSGGLVAVGHDGALVLPFNCAGMYRGYVKDGGIVYTAIYNEPYTASCE
jgi:L-asparaginase / beta-aspartyl-peptidase